MQQTLVDALNRGKPYRVCPLPLAYTIQERQLISVMERSGLVTGGINPVLTPAGIVEAQWFKDNR